MAQTVDGSEGDCFVLRQLLNTIMTSMSFAKGFAPAIANSLSS